MNPRLIALQGPPHDMGVQHGRLLKEQIQFLAKERYALAVEHAVQHGLNVSRDACLRLAHQHLSHHERFSPAVFEEFEGIARGAQISLEELFIANALTDFRDVLWQHKPAPVGVPGCTLFGIRRRRTADHMTYIGQNWDMHASAEPVIHVFHRQPDDGPSSLTVSTAGGLSLIGINEVGIAIGNSNLQPNDARPGVMYLAIIHEALRQTHFGAACRAITDCRRSSGHNYLLADDEGTIVNIETTAQHADEFRPTQPHYVHTNHYLSPRLQSHEAEQDLRSSHQRLNRLADLLEQHNEPLGVESLQQLMSDTDGGPEVCICREGKGREPRTCTFVALCPERRELWMTSGPPSASRAQRFGLN
jgi:isopenicillin-N N-acyltransferase like protein